MADTRSEEIDRDQEMRDVVRGVRDGLVATGERLDRMESAMLRVEGMVRGFVQTQSAINQALRDRGDQRKGRIGGTHGRRS